MTISERMFSIMEQKGVKPSDLAKVIGKSKSVISTWESRNTDPPARYMVQICDLLDVSLYYLLSGKNPEQQGLPNDSEIEQLIKEYKDLDRVGRLSVRSTIIQELQRLEIGRDVMTVADIKKRQASLPVSDPTNHSGLGPPPNSKKRAQ